MANGDDGRVEAALRFGRVLPSGVHVAPGALSAARHAPPGERSTRTWTVEAFMEHPTLQPIAVADAKFHGNRTALPALSQLHKALAALEAEHAEDED